MGSSDGISGASFHQAMRTNRRRTAHLHPKRIAPSSPCSRAGRLQVVFYHKRPRFARLRKGLFIMRNNRKSLLRRLYDGEFFPSEQVVSGNPDYVSISHKVGDEIEYVVSRLNGEDNARFQTLVDRMGELEDISGYSNFAYGLHTGILLMMELFFNEDNPPFRERN